MWYRSNLTNKLTHLFDSELSLKSSRLLSRWINIPKAHSRVYKTPSLLSPEAVRSTPHYYNLLSNIRFNIILSSAPWSTKWFFPWGTLTKIFYHVSSSQLSKSSDWSERPSFTPVTRKVIVLHILIFRLLRDWKMKESEFNFRNVFHNLICPSSLHTLKRNEKDTVWEYSEYTSLQWI